MNGIIYSSDLLWWLWPFCRSSDCVSDPQEVIMVAANHGLRP